MRMIKAEKLDEAFFRYRETEDLEAVKDIIGRVRKEGDKALRDYTKRFDRADVENFRVEKKEIKKAYDSVNEGLVKAMKKCHRNIVSFARRQLAQFQDFQYETEGGVKTGQRVIPLDRVGIYVPGGRYPLVSSLLMGAGPARTAGVREIAVCSPPSHKGGIHPAILVAADIARVDEMYRVGGAQAVAAMAYGTETVRAVDKIVGPGNKYVAGAKREVFGRVGIDLIAGPTELLILADENAGPDIIAADMLAQSEHDPDAAAVLITDTKELAGKVEKEVRQQLKGLETADTASDALENNGLIILVKDLRQGIDIANKRGPEHLELCVKNPKKYIRDLKNYGSLFIGIGAGEALGDYSSGINHTLPTNTAARYTGGLGIKDFVKLVTTLEVNHKGLDRIGEAAVELARAEGLEAHARSIEIRLGKKANGK